MSSVRALGASFAYTDAVPLFTDVTFHLPRGWTGFVGPNGAGKTTLLRVLAGELSPTSGTIAFAPERPLVVLCRQEVDALTPEVEALASSWEPEAFRLRGELGLDDSQIARWPTLSPGERKRWQVAAALSAAPDLLLLDEPTNHLDAAARAWLVRALQRFGGVGVLVSHDRALLDEMTQQTLRLHRGVLRLWAGPYSEARASWEEERRAQERAHAEAREAERRVAKRLREARDAQRATAAMTNAGRRMKGPKDSDARSLMADFRVAQAEKQIGREVAVVRRQLEDARAHVASFELEREVGGTVFLGYVPAPKSILASLEWTPLARESRKERSSVSVVLRRGDRIHLAGRNGAGKTTLIRALLASCAVPEERVVYLPQELSPGDGPALVRRVRALPPDVRGRVLSMVAALGVDPERLLASDSPSPGEARKLRIADGLGRHVWALILDEPSNHLDLPSVERLEAALARFRGALLLVTHDDALARHACRTRWSLHEGDLRVTSMGASSER